MRKIKFALAIWFLATIDLWLFCWSYRKPESVFFIGGGISLVLLSRIPDGIVRRMAKQNGKATYEHLFGFWPNAKWRRRKEEVLAGPPEMRRDGALMDALKQWFALGPLFTGGAFWLLFGVAMLSFMNQLS